MAVRLGEKGARLEYIACLLGAYIIPVALWGLGKLPILSLLVFLTLPAAIKLVQAITTNTGKALNKSLAGSGRLELLYALAFALGLIADTLIR